MPIKDFQPQAFNLALQQALEYAKEENTPALFCLIDSALLADSLSGIDNDPLTLIAQPLPAEDMDNEELTTYLASIQWSEPVIGAILAHKINFMDESNNIFENALAITGVLKNSTGIEKKALLQIEPGTLRGSDIIIPEITELLLLAIGE